MCCFSVENCRKHAIVMSVTTSVFLPDLLWSVTALPWVAGPSEPGGPGGGAIVLPPNSAGYKENLLLQKTLDYYLPPPPMDFSIFLRPWGSFGWRCRGQQPYFLFPKTHPHFSCPIFSLFQTLLRTSPNYIDSIELHTIHLISRHLLYYFMNNLSLQNDLRKYFQYFKQHRYNRPIRRIMYYEKCAILVRY